MKSFVIILCCMCSYILATVDVAPGKGIVWGPGLRPQEITMRARYVFIQLQDNNGNNVTVSPGNDVVAVRTEGKTLHGSPCHVWKQILDRKDGSFVLRYRIYKTCINFRMSITVKGENLVPPLNVDGPIYEEECDCPDPSLDDWLQRWECPESYPQITSDLRAFKSIDFDEMRESIIKRFDQPTSVSICHYVVKDNGIYRKCYGQHVGFKMFMDNALLSITRKVSLPDLELFVNLGDWPLAFATEPHRPIFSWCASDDTVDIAMPTYDITESTLENMGRVMLDMLSVQGNIKRNWSEKIEKAFWRGRDSRRERLDLVDISRKRPDLIDAAITNFFFFRNEMDKYGPKQNYTPFFDFFDFKYQLNIDGTVAAYRFPYLLAGDSLVFKQESKYYGHFDREIRPWEHYVPVKRDLSDLVEKLEWAKEHDDEAREISRNGQNYARNNLMPRDIYCYHAVLFKEWSKRVVSPVKILEGMEKVTNEENSECECHKTTNKRAKSKEEL